MIIAIDGPSGAGKSSIAKIVAKKLGFSCLDTGAMFRAIAVLALEKGVSLEDVASLGDLARNCEIEFKTKNDESGDSSASIVLIDGIDVTKKIRTAEIDKAVTPVSKAAPVRDAMLDQQRRIGNAGNFVVEGRDIGSVVFPNAELKIFLTATPEERAHRRLRQNADRNVGSVDYDEVLADIIRRDEADSTRKTAPLVVSDGAIVIDSTSDYIEDVIDRICELAKERM